MNRKGILVLVLILASIVGTLAVASAQSSTAGYVGVSPASLSFVGNEGQPQYNRTLTFVSLTNQTDTVALYPADLYDNSTGKAISMNNMKIENSTFTLTEASETTVNVIILNTKNVPSGTYQGTILGTASIYNSTTNKYQITLVKINVSLVIHPGISLVYSPEVLAIIAIIIAEFIAFLFPDEWRLKTIIVAFVGAAVIVTWIFILFYFGFSPTSTILTAIATIAIIPFGTWVIGYFNDKRTTSNDQIKSSRAIENDGNKSDIDLIRGVLGELETHAASFKPTVSEKKPFPTLEVSDKSKREIPLDKRARIFYTENGKLSRKVWDGSCKQGAMSDMPVLSLQRYYGFVDIYNRYYSCALLLTKDKEEVSTDDAAFLESFEAFRNQYANLQTVVYVELSYCLGLIIKTNLKPLPMEFPRVNRVFLRKMIEYGVLDPTKYPGNFSKSPLDNQLWAFRREVLEKHSLREWLRRRKRRADKLSVELEKEKSKWYHDKFETDYKQKYPDPVLSREYLMHSEFITAEFREWKKTEKAKEIEKSVKEKYADDKTEEINKQVRIALTEKYLEHGPFKEDFKRWKANKKSMEEAKAKALARVGAWKMNETGLENISDEIYGGDKIPVFYRKSEDDFDREFRKLETKAKDLHKLPDVFLKKEKQTQAVMDDATIKFLSDGIDGLKKLLNPPDADQPPSTQPPTNTPTTKAKAKAKPPDKT